MLFEREKILFIFYFFGTNKIQEFKLGYIIRAKMIKDFALYMTS